MSYSLYFLEQFTKELIINSAPTYINKQFDESRKEIRKVEKAIEQEISRPIIIPPRAIRLREYIDPNDYNARAINSQIQDVQKTQKIKDTLNIDKMQSSIMQRANNLKPQNFLPQRVIKKQTPIPYMEPTNKNVFVTKKEYPLEGIYLGAIERFIKDMNISRVECPGPNKYISVKTSTRMMTTRTILEREDIEAIIDSFSRETRIPRIGGIFKAIINNLILTAIDSEIGGPRFIITKNTSNTIRFLILT